jgi:hypothetical protein
MIHFLDKKTVWKFRLSDEAAMRATPPSAACSTVFVATVASVSITANVAI